MQKEIPKASLLSSGNIYDEQSLLLQTASGNEDAFAVLFNRYHHLLGQFIFKITKSSLSAEEITHDVFLKIWQARESLSEIGDFKAYLFRVARNQAINAVRTIIRERKRRDAWETAEIRNGQIVPFTNLAEKEACLSLIDQAIEQLPPQQKRAWTLSRQSRLTYKEIAHEMQISKTTVKSYIQLAVSSISKFVRENNGSIIPVLLLLAASQKN